MKISIVASSASSRVGIARRQKRNMAGAYSRYKSPQAWVSPARARTIKSKGSVFPGALIRPGLSGSICSTQEWAQTYHKSQCPPPSTGRPSGRPTGIADSLSWHWPLCRHSNRVSQCAHPSSNRQPAKGLGDDPGDSRIPPPCTPLILPPGAGRLRTRGFTKGFAGVSSGRRISAQNASAAVELAHPLATSLGMR